MIYWSRCRSNSDWIWSAYYVTMKRRKSPTKHQLNTKIHRAKTQSRHAHSLLFIWWRFLFVCFSSRFILTYYAFGSWFSELSILCFIQGYGHYPYLSWALTLLKHITFKFLKIMENPMFWKKIHILFDGLDEELKLCFLY